MHNDVTYNLVIMKTLYGQTLVGRQNIHEECVFPSYI